MAAAASPDPRDVPTPQAPSKARVALLITHSGRWACLGACPGCPGLSGTQPLGTRGVGASSGPPPAPAFPHMVLCLTQIPTHHDVLELPQPRQLCLHAVALGTQAG
ncbi:hypothetical protein VULLAG_LOCUS21770 [Vulpes lagopus]